MGMRAFLRPHALTKSTVCATALVISLVISMGFGSDVANGLRTNVVKHARAEKTSAAAGVATELMDPSAVGPKSYEPLVLDFMRGQPPKTNATDDVYGLVMDAGSTGTRIYIYTWEKLDRKHLPHVHSAPKGSKKPWVKKVSGGLADLRKEDSLLSVKEYLRPLLEYAMARVPARAWKDCPVFLLATAGVRLLPKADQNALLADVHETLEEYPFKVLGKHSVRVISGSEEGSYGWLAVNYLRGNLVDREVGVTTMKNEKANGRNLNSSDSNSTRHIDAGSLPRIAASSTVGALDMGGASTQITYMVSNASVADPSILSSIHQVTLFGQSYDLVTRSYLGFGFDQSLGRLRKALLKQAKEQNLTMVDDPCVNSGYAETVALKDVKPPRFVVVRGTGNFTGCRKLSLKLLQRNSTCQSCSCSGVNGGPVIRPPPDLHFAAFSAFYYAAEFFKLGDTPTLRDLVAAGRKYCSTNRIDLLLQYAGKVEEKYLQKYCFGSAYFATLLHDGYSFPMDSQMLEYIDEVDGTEVNWAMGALMVDIHRTVMQMIMN